MIFRYICIVALATLLLCACSESSSTRTRDSFNAGWAFFNGDMPVAFMPDYDDSDWERLTLPHDWSIRGNFSQSEPAGVAQGALPTGVGWYRKKFKVTDNDLKGRVFLEFDGIYRDGAIYINGTLAGKRPNGYSSCIYDVTRFLRDGYNVIAIRVDNSEQPSSRWYTGSGIYRNVWITKTNNVHVASRGTWIKTPLVNKAKANVIAQTRVVNENRESVDVDVVTSIYDNRNRKVLQDTRTIRIESLGTESVEQEFRIENPKLWDITAPNIYTAVSEIFQSGNKVDEHKTNFGIRSFYFDAEKGFILNDKYLKLNGVCLHHDFGCLGSVVNERALERRLQLLKDMGCNAIRTVHNAPAPELLNLCDRMGFLVVDEAFDVWHTPKTDFDYAQSFDTWGERDLAELIMRDRNHPSVILWSLGNNLPEQKSLSTEEDSAAVASLNPIQLKEFRRQRLAEPQINVGMFLARRLSDIARRTDPTRLVTIACDNVSPSNSIFRSGVLDVLGLSFNNSFIDSVRTRFPGKPFVSLASNSALMTRGFYKMPSTETYICPESRFRPHRDASLSCSSYDNCHTPWGSSHEETLLAVRDNDFVSGQFVWTGFDFLGDPTPYEWPARSSHTGILDLAGFPKDVYYLYQSVWQDEKTVLHLFPHWNWKTGDEVDVWCYFNKADEVELFLNGRSCGVRKASPDALHASWRVIYEAGTIRAVSRKGGKLVAERVITTAGRPSGLRLTADRKKIRANGEDLCFVTVEVVDKDGRLCPTAQNDVHFSLEGTARIEGVDNGCPYNTDPFVANHCRAFAGKCMVVLRSNGKPGNVKFTAKGEGLSAAELTIHCLEPDIY